MCIARNLVNLVICEGASEESYLRELNRALREKDINVVFTPFPVGNGNYSAVVKLYKKLKKDNPRSKFIIWIDKDIYHRNENKNMDAYKKKPRGIPDFCFNYYNFEDFLSLHLNDDLLNSWEQICKQNHHFTTPMFAKTYESLFQNILSNYSKGNFPWDTFDLRKLATAFKNNKNSTIQFSSDFLNELEKILGTEFINQNIIP